MRKERKHASVEKERKRKREKRRFWFISWFLTENGQVDGKEEPIPVSVF